MAKYRMVFGRVERAIAKEEVRYDLVRARLNRIATSHPEYTHLFNLTNPGGASNEEGIHHPCAQYFGI